MGEFIKPSSAAEFHLNFAQKKPLMSKNEAYYESSRCLFCYDAPCMNACPTGIDIPMFIKQIHTGNVTGAAKTIFDANWMGNACGKVCPTEELCEGACVYNHQDVKPIDIGRLQNFATDKVIKNNEKLFTPGTPNGRNVAIIGAGPAGLSCACELRMMGYEVDVFEAREKPSGLTVYGVAPYKITNEEALDEISWLQQQLSFNVHYNHAIQSPEALEKLEKSYDAVFLGVGLGPTASLHIEGEDMPHVIGAVEFVEELRMKQHQMKVPARVVVLGGGNTAMDAASESARMGAEEVTLAYRRGKADMGAYAFEYETILKSGARSKFWASPKRITAEGVICTKTEDRGGKLVDIPDSEFLLAADLVIKATGQAKCKPLFAMISGLETDGSGKVKVNHRFQTTRPQYFAGGDAVNGGAEVVNGAFEGKKAAQGIHQWLNEKSN